MLGRIGAAAAAVLLLCAAAEPQDEAARFGAREEVEDLSLSPDGTKVAFIAPGSGQGSALYVMGLEEGATAKRVLAASGDPERLTGCNWVADDRLVCSIYGVLPQPGSEGVLPMSRIVAVDATGGNVKLLSRRRGAGGGAVIDWLPDENGTVLMGRSGFGVNAEAGGFGVDRLDTRTLVAKVVEQAERGTIEYITDGRGTVRIRGRTAPRGATEMDTGIVKYFYRRPSSRSWEELSEYDAINRNGFNPFAVDHDRNLAYGFEKKDGRLAFFSVALDGSLKKELIFARPDVDVDGLLRIGRRNRVVGVSYATDMREPVYFDSEIKALTISLARALPKQPLVRVTDSSVDETKLLVFASSDDDAGIYYILDRRTKQLRQFMAARGQLAGTPLAKVKPVRYAAADGTMIPGYLTLPPGVASPRGLPAIVMPHGGPGARDEWGFDWLPQFYAARGYAVLQPNFRGSTGYGDAWFQENGFRSWKIAIGDVLDAGRWLVKEGIADPAKLGIVGWSYGGYAALQSAVVDPALFKAVVAIAPVTDLAALKRESIGWSDHRIMREFIGEGPHVREGSPAQNATKIRAPVLLFHGKLDRNVLFYQSRLMADKLNGAGNKVDLVSWDGLDHNLEDSAARTDMLRKSDGFLRAAMGM